MQRHQDSEPREQRDHGSAAVADQRQGHADDRQDAAHHAGIDEHIKEEAQGDGAPRQARKCVLALPREIQRPPDDHGVEREDQELSEQAEFLADDRENEIGRTLRQKFQLRLAAIHVSLAEYAARADRNLRLDDVVARAQRIGLGIQKSQYALTLVIMNEMPCTPGSSSEEGYRYQYEPKLQPREQHDDETGGGAHKRRSEIRLRDDHRGRNGD